MWGDQNQLPDFLFGSNYKQPLIVARKKMPFSNLETKINKKKPVEHMNTKMASTAALYSAMQCSAMHCSVMLCNEVQCNVIYCSAVLIYSNIMFIPSNWDWSLIPYTGYYTQGGK